MRTMLRISMETATSNKIIKETVQKLIQQTTELIKPEAAYFTADGGVRTVYFFFNLNDSSQMPVIAEPWFMAANAKVEYMPVMNAQDLQAGLSKLK